MTAARDAALAELRTVVGRAREQTAQVTEQATRARAGLRAEREAMRKVRTQQEAELRTSLRHGLLPSEQRALVERIERGETTWRSVLTGEDQHWSATGFRDGFGDRLEGMVEELRRDDPDFRAGHDAARTSADEVARRERERRAEDPW